MSFARLAFLFGALLTAVVVASAFFLFSLHGFVKESVGVKVPPSDSLLPLELVNRKEGSKTTNNLVERPLFWEGRRPIPEEAAEDVSIETPKLDMALPEGIKLLGVVVAGPQSEAILGFENDRLRAGIGDEVEGWLVENVEATKVQLRRSGQLEELSLERVFRSRPPRSKPAIGTSKRREQVNAGS